MKRLALIFVMFFLVAAGSANANPHHKKYGGGVDFNFFYGSLSPYGNWIEIDGMYGWRPGHVSHRWSPYTQGRWVWTSYGWYWDSYEPYGWAVYHYGRWYFDDYYGWIWIPDNEWGPSWVEWRYDDDYIGWAPLPPYAVFRGGAGIHFTFDWHFPYHHWNYVSVNHFCDNDGYRYYVPDKVKYRIHNQTRYRNDYEYRDNRVINRGIDRSFVEKKARTRIVERDVNVTSQLRDNSGSRNRDRVEIYRPDENQINRYRDVNRNNIQRAERKSSLNVERVEIGERNRQRNSNPSGVGSAANPQRPERIERINPNVQREQSERKREEPRVIESPSRSESPRLERERRSNEQPQVEKRSAEQERKAVAPQQQERRSVEPRQSPQPRQEPQVRERRNEETRQAPPKVERKEVDRRESGGGSERSRERRR